MFCHVDIGADVFETSSKRGYNVGMFQYNFGNKWLEGISILRDCSMLVTSEILTCRSQFLLADKVFEKIAEDFMKSTHMMASGMTICLCKIFYPE